MINLRYRQRNTDHILSFKHHGGKIIISLSIWMILKLKRCSGKESEMKKLGPLRYFLGIEVARSPKNCVNSTEIYNGFVKGNRYAWL